MVNELIEGEIYWTDEPKTYIFKTNKNGKGYSSYIHENCSYRYNNDEIYKWRGNIRLATLEEKHWLNECIKANKFIPFNEIKFNKTIEIW